MCKTLMYVCCLSADALLPFPVGGWGVRAGAKTKASCRFTSSSLLLSFFLVQSTLLSAEPSITGMLSHV